MSGLALPRLELQRCGGEALDETMGIIEQSFDPRFGEAWTRPQCAGILPMSGVTLMLAREAGKAIGFSLSRRVVDEAELLLIATLPEARGRGVAGALVDRFIADAQAQGATHLHLEVRDGNAAASLYQRRNFAIVGRRRQYYRGLDGDVFDALTMVRKFSGDGPK